MKKNNALFAIQRSHEAFDSFDPSSKYDPRNFAGDTPAVVNSGNAPAAGNNGLVVMAGAELAQFDISIVNAWNASCIVQLFNYMKSISIVLDASLAGGFPPFTGADLAAANTNSLVFWDHNGALVIRDAEPANVTIQCKQIAYRSLLESSSRTPFQIEKLRLTVQNDAQIDNEIFIKENTWLGKTDKNSLNPRTYFNPNQFQSKIIDIPLKTLINFERGLEILVNAGETINLSFFVSAYRKHSLK